MYFNEETVMDKKGETYILRSLCEEDAAVLMTFVEQGASESVYFPWAPKESDLTSDNATEYIRMFQKDERRLLLGAFRNGKLIGLSELSNYGSGERLRHRCTTGTAVLLEARGRGVGRTISLKTFDAAKEAGYEQAEANVAMSNEISFRNLQGMGFQEYGYIPHKYKNADGTYCDEHRMIKWL